MAIVSDAGHIWRLRGEPDQKWAWGQEGQQRGLHSNQGSNCTAGEAGAGGGWGAQGQ